MKPMFVFSYTKLPNIFFIYGPFFAYTVILWLKLIPFLKLSGQGTLTVTNLTKGFSSLEMLLWWVLDLLWNGWDLVWHNYCVPPASLQLNVFCKQNFISCYLL